MKNTKQTKNQNRQKIQSPLHSQDHSIHQFKKHPSGHTKLSTNFTIYSNHNNAIQQKSKEKIRNQKISCRNSSKHQGLLSSKSSKKMMKISLPNKKCIQKELDDFSQISEYCVINESFVPISTKNQKEIIDNLLANTASSSYDFTYFPKNKLPYKSNKESCHFEQAYHQSSKGSMAETIRLQRSQKAISCSLLLLKKEAVQISIEATPDVEQIGIQYSERKNKEAEKQQAVNKQQQKVEKIQFQPINSPKNHCESLADLLLKLEFSHLPNDSAFQKLSKHQKEHYSQLLKSLIQKMAYSPRSKMMPLLNATNSLLFVKQSQGLVVQDSYKQAQSVRDEDKNENEQAVLRQRLQILVYNRQCRQMSWIDFNQNQQSSQANSSIKQNKVNTTIYGVMNLICNFFCFVELHYNEEFLQRIRKIYGLTYREKYRRITRGISLQQDRRYEVISSSAFDEFINQSEDHQAYINDNEICHSNAIFDLFNQLLEQYRPFYLGNGELFPWSFKMYPAISQYSIDEDSIEIIFKQIKQKFVENLSFLCGMIVQYNAPEISNKSLNPIEIKRNERQNRLILHWLSNQKFEQDGVENFGTKVLQEVAEEIYKDLIIEAVLDTNFF